LLHSQIDSNSPSLATVDELPHYLVPDTANQACSPITERNPPDVRLPRTASVASDE
jgi:hypothetical protein